MAVQFIVERLEDVACPLEGSVAGAGAAKRPDLLLYGDLISRQVGCKLRHLRAHVSEETEEGRERDRHNQEHRSDSPQSKPLDPAGHRREDKAEEHGECQGYEDISSKIQRPNHDGSRDQRIGDGGTRTRARNERGREYFSHLDSHSRNVTVDER